MGSAFRLKSNTMFERPEEINRIKPYRFVFLAVEGNKTEQEYLKLIEKYRGQLEIQARVHIYPLPRAKNDHFSAPQQVLDLLEQYIELRNAEVLPEAMRDVIPSEYTDDFIKQYLNAPENLDDSRKSDFEKILQDSGIDLAYKRFESDFIGEDDKFGIMVDRDHHSHTVEQMKHILNECKNKGYYFFITTPCIEFWFLMHLVDVREEYRDDIQKFRDNAKISNKHTYTSSEVSYRAGHGKKIKEDIFIKYYLPKTEFAIQQVKSSFSTNVDELIGTNDCEDSKKGMLGSNLPELFDLLRNVEKDYVKS